MYSNYRINKAFDNLQIAIDNKAPNFRDIAFMLENEKQYKICKNRLELKFPETNVNFLTVSNYLADIYRQYIDDLEAIEKTIDDIEKNKSNLRPKFQEQQLTKLLNTNLSNLCNALEQTGCTDTLLLKHNKTCQKNKLKVLQLTKEQLDAEFNRNSRCTKSESYIKTAFWLNKFIKYINSIEEYVAFEYDTLLTDFSTLTPSEKDNLYLVAQKHKELFSTIYNVCQNDEDEKELLEFYQGHYSSIFNPILHKECNLKTDYKFFKSFEYVKSELYASKDQYINTIIIDRLIESSNNFHFSTIPNWGITDDARDKTKYIVCAHLSHYLFPCTFHYPKKSLQNTLEYLDINHVDLPRFNINNYFTDSDGNIFPVNIICSANQQQRSEIKKCSKQNPESKVLSYINNHLEKYVYADKKNPYSIEFD